MTALTYNQDATGTAAPPAPTPAPLATTSAPTASAGVISAAQQYGVNTNAIAAPAPAPSYMTLAQWQAAPSTDGSVKNFGAYQDYVAQQDPSSTATPTDGYKFVNYGGQQVLGMTQQMQAQLQSGAQMQYQALGKSMTAQQYDAMLNPTTWQARWNADGTPKFASDSVAPYSPGSFNFSGAPAPATTTTHAPAPGGGVISSNMNNHGGQGGVHGGAQHGGSGGPGVAAAPLPGWLNAASGNTPGSVSSATATQASQVTGPSMGSVQQVNPGSYDPATMTATGYDASTYKPDGYNAATYDNQGDQANVTNWNVDPNQTVQGQVSNIISADSPLMQRARAQGLMSANESGLLDSSLAVGSAQNAVLGAAEPMAEQDAQMYGRAASQNATEGNTTARFDADQAGQTGRANAGLINQAREFTANASNQAGQFNSGETNLAKRFTAGEQNTAGQFNATQKNQAGQFNTELAFKGQLANQDANLRATLTDYQGKLQTAMANADANNRLNLENLDNTAKEAIVNLQGKWNEQIQSTSSAGDAYRQMIATMGSIITDPNMDGTAKQAAVDQMAGMFDGYMQMEKSIGGLDLGNILTFQQYANGGANAPAPAPAPAGGGTTAPPNINDWNTPRPKLGGGTTTPSDAYNAYRASGGTMSPTDWYDQAWASQYQGGGDSGAGGGDSGAGGGSSGNGGGDSGGTAI